MRFFCLFWALLSLTLTLPLRAQQTCDDGQVFLSIDMINDDFCDCKDGSDELLTSACSSTSSKASFLCVNPGFEGLHFDQRVSASKVGDGICDCCDGSDERIVLPQISSTNKQDLQHAHVADTMLDTPCENTCELMFASIREKQEQEEKERKQGAAKFRSYVERGKDKETARQKKLGKVESDLKRLVSELPRMKEELDREEGKQQMSQQKDLFKAYAAIVSQTSLLSLGTSTLRKIIMELSLFRASSLSDMQSWFDHFERAVLPMEEKQSLASENKAASSSCSLEWKSLFFNAMDSMGETEEGEEESEERKLDKIQTLTSLSSDLCALSTSSLGKFTLFITHEQELIPELSIMLQLFGKGKELDIMQRLFSLLQPEDEHQVAEEEQEHHPFYTRVARSRWAKKQLLEKEGHTKGFDESSLSFAEEYDCSKRHDDVLQLLLNTHPHNRPRKPLKEGEEDTLLIDSTFVDALCDAHLELEESFVDIDEFDFFEPAEVTELRSKLLKANNDKMALETEKNDLIEEGRIEEERFYQITSIRTKNKEGQDEDDDDDEWNKSSSSSILSPDAYFAFKAIENDCFEQQDGKYTYEVCIFGSSKQYEGRTRKGLGTHLGEFTSFKKIEPSSNQSIEMVDGKPVNMIAYYKGGTKCWNGPERSMTVSVVCGNEDQLLDVEEPSPCEYTAVLKTPAVCFS